MFLLNLVLVQAQDKEIVNDKPIVLKTYTGTIESCIVTENNFAHPGIKIICNGKKYVLELDEETEFINMGKDGNGTFQWCPFYKGTYKVSGVLANQSIATKKIECVKNEGIYLRIIFQEGMFMQDMR